MSYSKPDFKMFIGIDISKNNVDIAILPTGETFTVKNDKKALKAILPKLPTQRNTLCVLEPTGKYEKLFKSILQKKGFAVATVHPTKVRQFARMKGQYAKTDAIDARILAEYGQLLTSDAVSKELPPYLEDLQELISRRLDYVEMRKKEKCRKEVFTGVMKRSVLRSIKQCSSEISRIEKHIKELIKAHSDLHRKYKLLISMKGVGEQTAFILLSKLPELGSLTRRSAASLAGIAPFNRDSGRYKGNRHIYGGRSEVRVALYMAALVASRHNEVFSRQYARMSSNGKQGKVILIAIARRMLGALNAMLRDGVEWQMSKQQCGNKIT